MKPRRDLASVDAALRDQLGQHDGLVVLSVGSPIDEGQCPGPGGRGEVVEQRLDLGPRELGAVSSSKLAPADRIVAEPDAERVAGRELACPGVERQASARPTPGPDAIDQDAITVLGRRWVVRPG